MSLTILISGLLPISVIAYLVAVSIIVNKIKNEQGQFWAEIGSPNIFDPNGQITIFLTLIFGRRCPQNISSAYQTQLHIVRGLLVLNLFCFLLLAYLISNGAFNG